MNIITLEKSWLTLLGENFFNETIKEIKEKLGKDEFYPPEDKIFKALELCTEPQTKVVIVGQDPYHQPGYADGLAFSVNSEIEIKKLPSSLKNIYNELKFEDNRNHNLEAWAKRGVLLLNSLLSIGADLKPHPHICWEKLTNEIVKRLSETKENLVFMLWGKKYAHKKEKLIARDRNHYILKASHPSSLSVNRGIEGEYESFKGCDHFSKANKFLKENGLEEIDCWKPRV